jgi:riboflavin kinase/FMN adenylyltransferase
MQHFHRLSDISLKASLATIGSFDGVHIGHQQIIRELVETARKAAFPAAVITFHPHPQLVVKSETRPYYLTLPEQRARLLGELGVDLVLTYPFSRETSQMPAEAFIAQVQERFNFSQLWIGHDFALGRNRQGNADYLRQLGLKYGYSIHEIPAFSMDGELVSSSRIRRNIREGNVKEAARLLGRPFELTGTVVRGENRGKSLGFPTSNLEVPAEMVDIKPGVYACLATLGDETWKAVTNVGYRPTFGDNLESPRIEAHLLDFSRDLYGQELSLAFIERIREERKFNQVSELIDQIQRDIELARGILKG